MTDPAPTARSGKRPVMVRLDDDDYQALHRIAGDRRVSDSAVVRGFIVDGLTRIRAHGISSGLDRLRPPPGDGQDQP